jgi:hypothetical protein
MIRDHLNLTTSEGVERLHGDWAADVAAYDKVHEQILQMADMHTMGIVKQFSNKFIQPDFLRSLKTYYEIRRYT